jgi:hypothetical protein
MIESYLEDGSQHIGEGIFGKSIRIKSSISGLRMFRKAGMFLPV